MSVERIHEQLRGLALPLDRLTPDPRNARRHDERNVLAIADSLSEHGQRKPLVAQRVGDKLVVRAGNGTLEAARRLRWTHLAVVVVEEGDREATRYALRDNRTADLATWDDDVLQALLGEVCDALEELPDLGWLPEEVGLGHAAGESSTVDAEPKLCKADELQEKWRTEPGQLWQLGAHRLLCGDSAKPDDVARLMAGEKADLWATDPPYGVAYESRGRKTPHRPIENDALPLEEMAVFWQKVAENALAVCSDRAPYYWFACQGGNQMMMMMMMSIGRAGWRVRHELVWVKDRLVLGRCDYHYRHEPILYGWKADGAHKWYGDRSQTSVLEFKRPASSDEHPTMKPVELLAYLVGNSTKRGDLVLDTFLGSGTTLIACEQLGRRCFGIELSPSYCAVILQRYLDATGQAPTRAT